MGIQTLGEMLAANTKDQAVATGSITVMEAILQRLN